MVIMASHQNHNLSASGLTHKSGRIIELLPGEVGIGFIGDQFKTLLGSCVSVILTDPKRTLATMCHIVHVGQPNAENKNNTTYGVNAMREMFRNLVSVGISPKLCQAFVFGGGNMFPAMVTQDNVGAKNSRWVMNFLTEQGIAVVAHSLEGSGYRKITWTVGPEDPVAEMVPVLAEADHVS
jgi:chemotaxis protein CheD